MRTASLASLSGVRWKRRRRWKRHRQAISGVTRCTGGHMCESSLIFPLPLRLVEQERHANAVRGAQLVLTVKAQIGVVDMQFADCNARAHTPHLHVVVSTSKREDIFELILQPFMEIGGERACMNL